MEEKQGLSVDTRMNSSSSTPYESAACSPRSSTDAAIPCFFSASTPTCPFKLTLNIESSTSMGFITPSDSQLEERLVSDEFDFSARFSEADQPWSLAPMSSADELFCNGQIRPFQYARQGLSHSHSAYSGLYIDDDHFDFQSSADYSFTMLSLHQSPASAMNKVPQYVGYGLSIGYSNQDQQIMQGALSHVRKLDGVCKGNGEHGGAPKGNGDIQASVSSTRQLSSGQDVDMIVKKHVEVEPCRGRRGSGSTVRRTRSLSPSRVFHMDDEVSRQPMESIGSLESAKEGSSSWEQEEKWERDEMARRKGLRLTLKELLHANEQVERGVATSKRRAWFGSKQGTKLNEGSPFRAKFLPTRRVVDSTKGLKHVVGVQGVGSPLSRHYSSPRAHSEPATRQTFLPYRHGLLACLGFRCKSYRAIAGIGSLHSKLQGGRMMKRV